MTVAKTDYRFRRSGIGLAIALPLFFLASAQAQVHTAAPVVPPAPAAAKAALTPSLANPVNALPPNATVPLAKPAPPAAPLPRARSSVAILQALDKVTAETIRFEVPVGQPVRYKTLVFTVRACETTAPDEGVQDFSAYVLIDSQPAPSPGKEIPSARQVFRGWMYASSPGLNPLQHPVYDAWLIACKATAPVTPRPASPPKPKPVVTPDLIAPAPVATAPVAPTVEPPAQAPAPSR